MPTFFPGQKVKVTKAAAAEGSNAQYADKVGEVRLVQQVGPGSFVIEVSFEGQQSSFWERWLELA